MADAVNHGQDAVHRLQQVRRHHRAECDEGLFLRGVERGGRRRQGRRPFRGGDRSRLVAGEGREGSRDLPASFTATRPSAAAIRCCRHSGWCRRPRPASTLRKFLDLSLSMVRSCGPDVPPQENPGVQLGLAMGIAGQEGRDKVTILSSKKIADFGAWAEQLIAESTGKDGKGLIPIDGEPLGDARRVRQGSFLHRPSHRRRNRRQPRRQARRAGKGRASGGSHRDEIDRSYRPGILPLRDRNRGRGRRPRHQSFQPARRRGRQDQDARADHRIRKNRHAS